MESQILSWGDRTGGGIIKHSTGQRGREDLSVFIPPHTLGHVTPDSPTPTRLIYILQP